MDSSREHNNLLTRILISAWIGPTKMFMSRNLGSDRLGEYAGTPCALWATFFGQWGWGGGFQNPIILES